MTFRDKGPKKKANSDNEYYNCHKLEYFERDCFLLDWRLNRMTQQSRKGESQRRDSHKGRSGQSNIPNRAYHIVENKYNNNPNLKSFAFGPLEMLLWLESKNCKNSKLIAPGSWIHTHPITFATIENYSATWKLRAWTLWQLLGKLFEQKKLTPSLSHLQTVIVSNCIMLH